MKILLATSRYPWPPRRGDQIRAVQALDFLAGEHEVTLLTPEPGKGQPAPPADAPYRVELYKPSRTAALLPGMARVLLRNHPLQSVLFYQPDLGRRLRELAPRADLGILQLVRLAIHLDDFGGTPILVDLIDSLSLNFSLRAEVDRLWLRPLLRLEAHLLAIGERRLTERAAGVIVVCGRDRQALVNRLPPEAAAKVAVVRLAMRERRTEPPLPNELLGANGETGPVLAMTGNLGYFVNVDAISWWLDAVWPAVRQARPDVRVVVAGDRPAPEIRRAVAKAGPRVRLLESPRDMRSVLAQSTLALAPMRCGSGVPVKVLEAWAVGVPVIATPWAVAGTSGRQGEDFQVVGTHPIEWVRAILELLDDPEARERLCENGRRRLAADYSREVVRDQLLGVIRELRVASAGASLEAPELGPSPPAPLPRAGEG
ncbi:MAG TPA: glycosyltransferase family 4 protein [Thermoanaerobaculia bacterium]|nr:glycosyltransferase family 4 protein [Thermoanaerobaculia bacterium]